MAVTLNCDMGEGFGLYKIGDDEGIMPLIDVANVACGFHASDPDQMRLTVRRAKKHGVQVGAHPSLPDLQGFGRREMKMNREEVANLVIYQVGALVGFLQAEGMTLNHIKPHGSLYHMAGRQEEIAQGICDAADIFDVPLFGMTGTMHETVYRARGKTFVAEYYADLDYAVGGTLILTREHDAKDPSLAAERCIRAIKDGQGTCIDESLFPVRCETICIHSDTPNALDITRTVRDAIAPWH
ncbi:5-oxoprolinase subunit PxpA [Aureimonas altamirensis]|uniref:5-oxoprolinase subunit PxpA n=1 Tax=Aureimonas altamirensis TaxID=370622 RepID=UPI001E453FE1|nr:5-oxoprolinase subunit PxpA [Aureimonas altamirensis]UHD43871.1 5-oxoprolinase subunit PxpA [Aureimonas altamirensis]